MPTPPSILVIGGGAAGFFGAIRAAVCHPQAQVILLEKSDKLLSKVRISGGGRCNVTHACFDPGLLIHHYPRGEKELLGPFHHFAAGDTVDGFEQRGVKLKVEADGRMFPVSDRSQTIIDCLLREARRLGVDIRSREGMKSIKPSTGETKQWVIETGRTTYRTDKVLLATGSSKAVWKMLEKLGMEIVPPVPSLFTFNTKDPRLRDLSGISVPQARLCIADDQLEATGPLLITHWGLSGPAVLKLSAWGAHALAAHNYRFRLVVNWLDRPEEAVEREMTATKREWARKQVAKNPLFDLPARLWEHLAQAARIPATTRWADLNKKQFWSLLRQLVAAEFAIAGKSTFKEEFVTAGGVHLREIDFRTFSARRFPGLYLAGEMLDIDAITGGFNFQAAWTGGYLAGTAMGQPAEVQT